MVTRLHFDDPDAADAAADALYAAGHEIAVVKERFDGEDDDEEVSWVVATPATAAEVGAVLSLGDDVFVEADEDADTAP